MRVQSFKRHSLSPRRTKDISKEKGFQYNIIRKVLNAMLNAIMEICSMNIDAENIKSFWGGNGIAEEEPGLSPFTRSTA